MAQQYLSTDPSAGQTHSTSGSPRYLSTDPSASTSHVSAVSADEPDTFTGGFFGSLLDTAKRAGKGILGGLNPINTLHDMHDTLARRSNDPEKMILGEPSTGLHLSEFSDPEKGGHAIGSLLLGELVGRAVPYVPKATSATGRVLESVGSVTKKPLTSLGAIEAAARMDPKGLAIAAAPYAAEYAGKGLQKLGDVMDGLRGGGKVAVDQYLPNQSGYAPSAGTTASELQRVPYAEQRASTAAQPAPVLRKNGGLSLEDHLSRVIDGIDTTEPAATSSAPVRAGETSTPAETFRDANGEKVYSSGRPSVNADWYPEESRAPAIDHAAASENVHNGASFGNGHIVPEPLPTELRNAAQALEDTPHTGTYAHESGVGAVIPADLSIEAGNPDIPALTVGEIEDNPITRAPKPAQTQQLPESWQALVDGEQGPPAAARLDQAVSGLSDEPQYTDFANAIDATVNAAAAEGLPESKTGWLSRTRLSNAEKAWLQERQQSDPHWPYKDITASVLQK